MITKISNTPNIQEVVKKINETIDSIPNTSNLATKNELEIQLNKKLNKTDQAESAKYADNANAAIYDGIGNEISNTYSTKEELENKAMTPGPAGKDGLAATIEVGQVREGAPGTHAYVTNTGTSTNAVFDFIIPKGKTGEQGPKGDPADTSLVISKEGDRGVLAGKEQVYNRDLSYGESSITISGSFRDSSYIKLYGTTTLFFTAETLSFFSTKIIGLYAKNPLSLSISGATWANGQSAPAWGSAGKELVLAATFINGHVILSVVSNNE